MLAQDTCFVACLDEADGTTLALPSLQRPAGACRKDFEMTQPSHTFHIAGLLIRAAPGRVADVARNLAAVPGLQVHAEDKRTGRIVVTLETASIEEQEAQFAWVRTLREVRAVDLVCHYFES